MPKRIKQMRFAKGMTQTDLAKAVGVSQQAVSNWENGSRVPKFTVIQKLCEIFNCNIGDIAELV